MEQEGYVKCYIYTKHMQILEYDAENKYQEIYVASLKDCNKY